MYNTKFVIDDRLISENMSENDDFGRGVCMIDNSLFVGCTRDEGASTYRVVTIGQL